MRCTGAAASKVRLLPIFGFYVVGGVMTPLTKESTAAIYFACKFVAVPISSARASCNEIMFKLNSLVYVCMHACLHQRTHFCLI